MDLDVLPRRKDGELRPHVEKEPREEFQRAERDFRAGLADARHHFAVALRVDAEEGAEGLDLVGRDFAAFGAFERVEQGGLRVFDFPE